MNYKFLFLIGSSLKHFAESELSAYNEDERFEQTLDTIESVRSKVPNAYVVLFETSYKKIKEEHKNILEEKVDLFLDFTDDVILKQIYSILDSSPKSFAFAKSFLETRGLLLALYHVANNNLFSDTYRVFKLTGRYKLNDYFEIKDYENSLLSNHYVGRVFKYPEKDKKSFKNQNTYSYVFGCDGSIVTGLWSFSSSLIVETVQCLEKCIECIRVYLDYTGGIDIEHSLYRFLDKDKLLKVNNLGLDLIKGMDGEKFSL